MPTKERKEKAARGRQKREEDERAWAELDAALAALPPERRERLEAQAADFDPDEHIEMWIEARKNGVRGVPSTRELLHDAEDIDKMLQELASALREAEEANANGG